jgi:hypothetical protein
VLQWIRASTDYGTSSSNGLAWLGWSSAVCGRFTSYSEDRKRDAEHLEELLMKEQKAAMLQRKATLYADVSRVAATLAASKNEKTRQEAEERFLQLFYGELAGVEDRSVELATIAGRKRGQTVTGNT